MQKSFADLCFLLDPVTLPEHQHDKAKEEHADKEEHREGESQLNFEGVHVRGQKLVARSQMDQVV